MAPRAAFVNCFLLFHYIHVIYWDEKLFADYFFGVRECKILLRLIFNNRFMNSMFDVLIQNYTVNYREDEWKSNENRSSSLVYKGVVISPVLQTTNTHVYTPSQGLAVASSSLSLSSFPPSEIHCFIYVSYYHWPRGRPEKSIPSSARSLALSTREREKDSSYNGQRSRAR